MVLGVESIATACAPFVAREGVQLKSEIPSSGTSRQKGPFAPFALKPGLAGRPGGVPLTRPSSAAPWSCLNCALWRGGLTLATRDPHRHHHTEGRRFIWLDGATVGTSWRRCAAKGEDYSNVILWMAALEGARR